MDFGTVSLDRLAPMDVPNRASLSFKESADYTANYLATVRSVPANRGSPHGLRQAGPRIRASADSVIPEPVFRACLAKRRSDFTKFSASSWRDRGAVTRVSGKATL